MIVIRKEMNGDLKMNNKTHIMIFGELRRIIYNGEYRGYKLIKLPERTHLLLSVRATAITGADCSFLPAIGRYAH